MGLNQMHSTFVRSGCYWMDQNSGGRTDAFNTSPDIERDGLVDAGANRNADFSRRQIPLEAVDLCLGAAQDSFYRALR